jgi:hypothetical protein
MLDSHWLNLIFLLTEAILQTFLQKKFESFQTFFLTDIQTYRLIQTYGYGKSLV